MPRFEWKEDDMAYSLAFFPLVGILIGGVIVLLNGIAPVADLPVAVRILLTLAASLIITGGIHIDGFLDVEDALHSYASGEKKLEILKDPHIGAFAVISLIKWMLLYAAAVTAVLLHPKTDIRMLAVFGIVFAITRCLSGLTSLCFQKAKKEGMLYQETQNRPPFVLISLILQLVLFSGVMVYLHVIPAIMILLTLGFWTVYYHHLTKKQFGGVTGDTAGFFLTIGEILAAAVLAVAVYMID